MKKRIRIKESDFRNIVKKCVNEAIFGGESFHGGNADDWDAIAGIRNKLYFKDPINRERHSKSFEKATKNNRELNPFAVFHSEDSVEKERKAGEKYGLNEGNFKKDTVQGKHLRYTPEDSGFDSKGQWNFGKNYSEDKMFSLVDESISYLEKARTYARENGNGKIYMLLNEIIGELWDVINQQS